MAKRSSTPKTNPLKNRMTKNVRTALEKMQFEMERALRLKSRAGKQSETLEEIATIAKEVVEKIESISRKVSKLPDDFKAERVVASKAITPGCLVVFKEEVREKMKEAGAEASVISKPFKVLSAGSSGPRPYVVLESQSGKGQQIVKRADVELYEGSAAA